MPRRKSAVKPKELIFLAPGMVDLHFHGAFGIDFMTASPPELDRLALLLSEKGVAAFCPTTLSAPREVLAEVVTRVGTWIREKQSSRKFQGAVPLGIHLEGPFIHPEACGAHPPGSIRALDLNELEQLWKLSRQTLKILTVAPESIPDSELKQLVRWAKKRKIVLSLGHSRATQKQATRAFRSGFSGVTHAWNALPFHQRAPGVLGSALGKKGVYLELIVDQVHVSPEVIRWTLALHGKEPVCFVSDCVPAAEATGWVAFGPLQIQFENGACRLRSGHLAGGGLLLPESYRRWVEQEALATGQSIRKILTQTYRHISSDPLKALGFSARNKGLKIKWAAKSGRLRYSLIPID